MRTVKVEKCVYKYAELQADAKKIVCEYVLSVLHDSYTFTEYVKSALAELNIQNIDLYYNLDNCQGDGFCFTGVINWIDFNKIAKVRNEINKLNTNFVISCNDCLNDIRFIRINHNYCHNKTIFISIDNSNWMNAYDYMALEDIIMNWYSSICNRYEKEGYKWFEEIDEQEVIDYCTSNELEFLEDGTIFVESA